MIKNFEVISVAIPRKEYQANMHKLVETLLLIDQKVNQTQSADTPREAA